jgi:hypothetical protein
MKTHFKTLILFAAILALLAVLMAPVGLAKAGDLASTAKLFAGGKLLTFTFTADSAAHDTSGSFGISEYDDENLYNFPIAYEVVRTPSPATVDTANVSFWLDGSFDNVTYTRLDTIYAFADSTVTTGRAVGTIDFMNAKRPYYQIEAIEKAKEGGAADTTGTWVLKLWLYRKF